MLSLIHIYKYLIQKGNKRYAAYQFLNKKYDSDYDKIECYILDYEIEDDKKEIDPMFTLQLMRDNICLLYTSPFMKHLLISTVWLSVRIIKVC